jgi:hypothetical protein
MPRDKSHILDALARKEVEWFGSEAGDDGDGRELLAKSTRRSVGNGTASRYYEPLSIADLFHMLEDRRLSRDKPAPPKKKRTQDKRSRRDRLQGLFGGDRKE